MEALLHTKTLKSAESVIQKKTILIVDDTKLNREILKQPFVGEYHILEAVDGEQAYEMIKENKDSIAAILLDIMMPRKDGFYVLEELQKDKELSEIPVIMITACGETEAAALQGGAWDFIHKPFDIEIIKTRVEGAVKRSYKTNMLTNEKVAYEGQLAYLVDHDSLTGLYNRRGFLNKTERLIKENQDKQFVICRMDINRFKIINELFGRAVGNELICFIADILKRDLGNEELCSYGRMNSDVFYMCFPYEREKTLVMIPNIEQQVANYQLDFEVIISFGLYVIDEPELEIGTIYDRANIALSKVKGNYLNRYAFYDVELHSKMLREQEIISQMRGALEDHQFHVFLQPKCNLDNGEIIGAEALTRWFHPEKGIISPLEFIPIFESSGFITRLDYYIWEEVCKLLKQWINEGKNPIPISVNISRVHLYNSELSNKILSLVEKYQISPKLLELEVTESVYTDNQNCLVGAMEDLRTHGFVVMMDDFGSGYSSLNMLKDIIVDVLKVDLKFLSGDDSSGRGASIISSVVRMAKWLSLPVIIEGVETKEQVEFLRSIGCTTAQGYYFAKPMPIEEFEELYYCGQEQIQDIVKNRVVNNVDLKKYFETLEEDKIWYDDMVGAVGLYEVNEGHLETIRLNNNYFEMIGTNRENFYENCLCLMDWIPEEDHPIVHNMFSEAYKTKKIVEGCYRRNCADGKVIWLHTKVKFWAGDDVRQLYLATMSDVTKMKTVEMQLKDMWEDLEKTRELLPMDLFLILEEKIEKLVLQVTPNGTS